MSERARILKLVSEAVSTGARRRAACDALGLSPRTLQRWEKDLRDDGRKNNRFAVSNALTPEERKSVLDVACSPEYRDLSPNQIVPILAEKGQYLASESTIYRILNKAGLLTHRSRAKAPERQRPDELKAVRPNQVWTWDISYLLTLVRGSFLYLYLMLDIWDRSIVGWAIHETENGKAAADLLYESCTQHNVERGSVTLHNDNGAPMISAELLTELSFWGQPSYSRPGVCDDNPYSESLFRTLKYRPGYPMVFENIEQARAWVREFVRWYNYEHRHSGIGFVTPMQRRRGEDGRIMEVRTATYEAAREAHPERWSRNIRNWEQVTEVVLNPRDGKKSGQRRAA